MRVVVGLVSVVALLAASQAATAGGPSGTSLRIAYWDDGSAATPNEVWTVRCDPPRGTLARPALACRNLASGGWKLFAPVPPNMACTQIYGGPQKAQVTGTLVGRRVWATFARSDGCRIARWNRFVPWLLPPGGATK